jgi:hypothetical protein
MAAMEQRLELRKAQSLVTVALCTSVLIASFAMLLIK